MPYYKLKDKDPTRHDDPALKVKIVRAKLRDMVSGRLSRVQKMLIETMVPMYLELLDMQNTYGTPGFDFDRYVRVQNLFRTNLGQLANAAKGYGQEDPESWGVNLSEVL